MNPEPRPAATPVNPYWKAVIVSGFLFVGTTLAIVMTQFGDPQAPGNIFFRRHGALLAAIEVGAVLITGVLAMAIDQRQTREAVTNSQDTSKSQLPTTNEPNDVG